MNELPFYGTGNLTHDPELRFTPAGKQVVSLSIAFTPRRFDKDSNAWVDGQTTFLRGSVWGPAAENVAESLTRGMRVVVTGTLHTRVWTDRDSVEQRSLELRVDEIGPSLQFATAKVVKATRGGDSLGPDEVEPAF